MRTITLSVLLMISVSMTTYADIVVVVHPDNPLTQASNAEVSKIFLAKTKTFSNGEKIKLLDLEEGHELRDQFYQSVANKTPSQVKAYWSRLIFTGKGQPPQVLLDSDEIVEAIEEDANGIGYIDPDSVTDSVKVILTLSN
ncbi:MAG: phosphate ABC transporter substrate-binding protein [Gammaproteobacteria bacterium]|nr:phosphate ABC transporter substrate-binding protein [Gammaproteobacteria bacterium]